MRVAMAVASYRGVMGIGIGLYHDRSTSIHEQHKGKKEEKEKKGPKPVCNTAFDLNALTSLERHGRSRSRSSNSSSGSSTPHQVQLQPPSPGSPGSDNAHYLSAVQLAQTHIPRKSTVDGE
jgi:hypothetical protein